MTFLRSVKKPKFHHGISSLKSWYQSSNDLQFFVPLKPTTRRCIGHILGAVGNGHTPREQHSPRHGLEKSTTSRWSVDSHILLPFRMNGSREFSIYKQTGQKCAEMIAMKIRCRKRAAPASLLTPGPKVSGIEIREISWNTRTTGGISGKQYKRTTPSI